MRINLKTKYAEHANAIVRWARYGNGNVAMRLMDPTGESIMVPTVNMGVEVGHGHVALKTWTENEGIEAALVRAGVVEREPVGVVKNGYVEAPIYRLTAASLGDLAESERGHWDDDRR